MLSPEDRDWLRIRRGPTAMLQKGIHLDHLDLGCVGKKGRVAEDSTLV